MHKSSIGLLVCLKCGNTLQPSEASAYNPNLPPDQQNQALQPETLYSKDPFAAPQPSPYYQANNPAANVAYNNDYTPPPLESYLEGVPGQSQPPSSLILSRLANTTPKQKKIALALLSLVFVASILGGFFGYNDYQTTKTLKQGIAQDQQGKFDDASDTLAKADKGIAYPGTKKAVDKEIANNKRWTEYYAWHKQAEDLINGQQYAAALELLYKINNDYPLYGDVSSLIAIAEAGGDTSVIAGVTVDRTPQVAGESASRASITIGSTSGGTKIIPYTPGGGGGVINPPVPTTRPIIIPPYVTPTPIAIPTAIPTARPTAVPTAVPTATPTRYVYKGDGSYLGIYIEGNTCSNYIYFNGSNNVSLTIDDCSTEIPEINRTDMGFANSSCTGTGYARSYFAGVSMIVGTNKVWRGVSNNNTVTLNSVIKIGSDVCKPIAPEYYPGNITSWQYIRLWTIPSSIKCGGVAPCYMQ